jgi:hypothetical protein
LPIPVVDHGNCQQKGIPCLLAWGTQTSHH